MDRARSTLLSTAALLLLPGSGANAQSSSPREIAAEAGPAVVVVTSIAGGRDVGRGSGFVVNPDGLVVTNWHVVEGADDLRIRLSSGEEFESIYFVSADPHRDLVLLRLPGADLPSLRIGDDQASRVGDAVYVMGNPLGLERTFSDGLISAKRFVDGSELIQITAPISSGSSGGPVFNGHGEVIGVATAMIRDGQNLNLAVPVRYLSGLLALDEQPRPFSRAVVRHVDSGSSLSDDTALPPWAEALVAEAQAVDSIAAGLAYSETHEPYFEMLDHGEVSTVELTLDRGRSLVVGVCDVDCADLDIVVRDPADELVGYDSQLDARPYLEFDVPGRGTYKVEIRMVECRRSPCGLVVRAYEIRSPTPPPSSGHADMLDAMAVGFAEVAPGQWASWTASLETEEPTAMFARSVGALAAFTTNQEYIEVLEWRSFNFRAAANDSALRWMCAAQAAHGASIDFAELDVSHLGRIGGRALAREHRGYDPWESPVDLTTDTTVWEALGSYLVARGFGSTLKPLLVLAEGGTIDDRTSCLWQSDLYGLASLNPHDRVGPLTLLEFVRAMDLLGAAVMAEQ